MSSLTLEQAAKAGFPSVTHPRLHELVWRITARAGAPGDVGAALRTLGDFRAPCAPCGEVTPWRLGFPVRCGPHLWSVEAWCRRCRSARFEAALILDGAGPALFWQDLLGHEHPAQQVPVDWDRLVRFVIRPEEAAS